MQMHIIAIHGLNNKPKQETLLQRWRAAIDEGLRKNQGWTKITPYSLEMVYWADLGYPGGPLPDDDLHYGYTPHPGDGPLPEYESQWVEDRVAGRGDLRRGHPNNLGAAARADRAALNPATFFHIH